MNNNTKVIDKALKAKIKKDKEEHKNWVRKQECIEHKICPQCGQNLKDMNKFQEFSLIPFRRQSKTCGYSCETCGWNNVEVYIGGH